MTYEYLCMVCKARFEREQKISDKPSRKCLKCGKRAARRLISSSGGFQLKGSGWAKDGYGPAS